MSKPSPKLTLPAIQPIRKTGGRKASGAIVAIEQADAVQPARPPASKFKVAK